MLLLQCGPSLEECRHSSALPATVDVQSLGVVVPSPLVDALLWYVQSHLHGYVVPSLWVASIPGNHTAYGEARTRRKAETKQNITMVTQFLHFEWHQYQEIRQHTVNFRHIEMLKQGNIPMVTQFLHFEGNLHENTQQNMKFRHKKVLKQTETSPWLCTSFTLSVICTRTSNSISSRSHTEKHWNIRKHHHGYAVPSQASVPGSLSLILFNIAWSQ